jgi:hypothetical protein
MLNAIPTKGNVVPLRRRPALVLPPDTHDTLAATILRVTPATIGNWRSGKCQPQARHRKAVAALRALLRVAQGGGR